MKRFFLILTLALAVAPICKSQVVATPTGAKLSLDSVTTEIIVYSPEMVRVVKYVGERPKLSACKELKVGKGDPQGKEYARSEGHHKYKVDTGRYFAAINDKDGNVSFWNYDDQLILAEQHKTGRLGAPSGKKGVRKVSQDFQFGRAEVDSIWCDSSADRVNLRDRVVSVGDRRCGLPDSRITTEKGWSVVWNSSRPATLNARWEREGRKKGDITFTSPSAQVIDYFFLLN